MRLRGLLAAVLLTTAAPALVAIAPSAVASAPTVAPVLLAPDEGAAAGPDTVFRWGVVTGATGYEVQVATDPNFAAIVYDQRTSARSIVPAQQLPTGTLYWNVRATDVRLNVGPASATRTIVTPLATVPSPITPADGEQKSFPDDPPIFSWTAVDGAKSYLLEVDDGADFISPTAYQTANTSFTLTTPQTSGQTYWWRVTATLVSGQSSAPSPARSYSVGWASQPTLIAPVQGQTVAEVVFHWSTVPGAATYNLQVSPNSAFANNPAYSGTKLTATQFSPPKTLDNGTYFWRVQAVDAAGDIGTWSATATFVRDWVQNGVPERPSLLTPAYSAGGPIPHVAGDLGLSWTPVHHASRYQIEISTDLNFSPATSSQCFTNHTTFQPYTRSVPSAEGGCAIGKLSTGIGYYWHVRGIDDPGAVQGVWSSTWRFLVDPAGPTPLAPLMGEPLTNGVQWAAVPGVEKYKVLLRKPDGSAYPGSPFTTYGTSWSPASRLSPDGTYSWEVQAVDGNGDVSAVQTANWPTFSTPSAGTASAVTLTAPDDGAASDRMPALAWTPVPPTSANTPTTYDVYASIDGFDQLLASGVPYASYTPTGVPLSPGTYSWWVQPHNSSVKDASDVRTFTVLDVQPTAVVPAGDYLTPSCGAADPCGDTPTFSWKRVDGAGWYIVSLALDPHFTNVLRSWGTAYTSFTPRESLVDNQAGQSYYWFVRPCIDSSGQRCGPSPTDEVAGDNAARFQKRSAAVTGLLPADGTSPIADQVTLGWDDYLDTGLSAGVPQEAAQYVVQVSAKQDFSTLLDTATVDQTTYTAGTITYPEGPIYWRVQAVDASGNQLTWSAPQLLTKQSPAPTLTAPVGGVLETGVPALQWQPLPFAATYTVQLFAQGDTSFSVANRVASLTTAYSSWAPTQGLASGLYAWRVQRIDGGKQPGQWSTSGLFRLQADAPTLLAPADTAALRTDDIVFSWQPANTGQKVAQYRWQVSNSSGFGTSVNATTVNHAWAPTTAIGDGSWYWRIQVLDGAGNVLGTSAVRSFTKDTSAPTVTSTVAANDVPVSGSFTISFSEPVLHVSATSVTLTPADGGSAVPARVTLSGSTARLAPLGPLTPGQHYRLSVGAAVTDLSGNPLTPWTRVFRTHAEVPAGSPVLIERWDHDAASGASGGGYDVSPAAGASATFTFTGTSATLLGTRLHDGGYADVYLDGTRRARASFFSATTRYRQPVWSVAGLASGAHTVRLRVLGTHPAGSAGSNVAVDALKAGTTVLEERAAVETFAHSAQGYDWASQATRGDNGGAPTFSVTLRGTSVYVYGLRSTGSGRMVVALDGRTVATVDLRASTTQTGIVLWASKTLTDTLHTVRMTVLGTASGAGSAVGVADVRAF